MSIITNIRVQIIIWGLFVFCLLIPYPLEVWSLELTTISHLHDIKFNFRHPSDVAVANDGKIYVVDGVNQAVKAFNQRGEFLFSFGAAGTAPGFLNTPLGIDIDENGRIYLADSGNRKVQIFSSNGEYINEILLSTGENNTPDPTDIAVNRNGTVIFIVDNDNHCILKYDLNSGKLLRKFGRPGIERMEFRYPFLISCFNDKYLYIVDVINTRVQEITTEGKFVRYIGDWGVEKGQFFRPKGVAVDSRGRVYVSDSYLGIIQVFVEGAFHSVLGDDSTGKHRKFNTPMGIFIDHLNQIYVVEMFSNNVSVFKIES